MMMRETTRPRSDPQKTSDAENSKTLIILSISLFDLKNLTMILIIEDSALSYVQSDRQKCNLEKMLK
jgi:hypothetical protein